MPPEKLPEPPTNMTEDQGKIAAALVQAREAMYAAMTDYRKLLQDSTLAGNRTKAQKDEIERAFAALNAANGEMERLNVGEAPLTLLFTALNAILLVKDQANELKFSNALLLRRIESLEKDREPIQKAVG